MRYLLKPDNGRKYKYAWKDASFLGYEKTICSQCGRTVTVPTFNREAHCLILEGGIEFPDYLAFTGAGKRFFLLSERALHCLREGKISGISGGEPVKACMQNGDPIDDAPKYVHLEITGQADLDHAAMQLKKKRACPACGQFEWNRQRLPAMILNTSAWDGSDICRLASIPGFIVCTDKFKAIVQNNQLKGFSFEQVMEAK